MQNLQIFVNVFKMLFSYFMKQFCGMYSTEFLMERLCFYQFLKKSLVKKLLNVTNLIKEIKGISVFECGFIHGFFFFF